MTNSDDVRRAYYRATAKRETDGERWPLIGSHAVDENAGTVSGGFSACTVLANFSRDALGRVRLRLNG